MASCPSLARSLAARTAACICCAGAHSLSRSEGIKDVCSAAQVCCRPGGRIPLHGPVLTETDWDLRLAQQRRPVGARSLQPNTSNLSAAQQSAQPDKMVSMEFRASQIPPQDLYSSCMCDCVSMHARMTASQLDRSKGPCIERLSRNIAHATSCDTALTIRQLQQRF